MRAEVARELRRWSLEERLEVAEELLRLIRSDLSKPAPAQGRASVRRRMQKAAGALRRDYAEDEELTAFTALDGEDVHEAG